MAANGGSANNRNSLDNSIAISVKGQDGRHLYFKVDPRLRLIKLMRTFCERRQLEYETVQFIYDGNRVNGRQTPKQLKMKDDAEILAMFHHTGGGGGVVAALNF